jgi:sugar porter (SP) family MFS transporter
MSESEFAFVSSIFTLGGLFGALSAGPVSTGFGRLPSMRIATSASIVGSLLEALASHVSMLVIGRVLAGVGAGVSLVVVPLYVSEVAPPQSKGLFGTATQIAVNLGILLTLLLGYIFGGGPEWRIVLAVGAGIGAVQGIFLCAVSESPTWTAANRDPGTAVGLLQRIRGKDFDIVEEIQNWNGVVPKSLADELDSLLDDEESFRYGTTASNDHTKNTQQIGFLEVVRSPLYRPALIAVVGVMMAQQLTGINSVMMYSVELMSNLFPTSAGLLSILLSLINFVATILCAPLPDKLGRKPTLLLSISGMGLSSLALALSMLFNLKVLSAISAICFVASFGVGVGAIPFILASELVDQEASSATQGWGLASNWIATFSIAQFCPMINDALNAHFGGTGWVYFIFTALALVSGLFVVLRVPETKGRKNADEVWDIT